MTLTLHLRREVLGLERLALLGLRINPGSSKHEALFDCWRSVPVEILLAGTDGFAFDGVDCGPHPAPEEHGQSVEYPVRDVLLLEARHEVLLAAQLPALLELAELGGSCDDALQKVALPSV